MGGVFTKKYLTFVVLANNLDECSLRVVATMVRIKDVIPL